ncbi:MAG: PspC domain-containing protein [Lachnospiraceae bacterium]|nr:PspC domain-containing protein [Lachnospiraceae bacterium]
MDNNVKRLLRSRTNRSICGVCGGLGEYLGFDPVVVRLLWVVFSFMSVGMGVLVYFIAAMVIPEAD